MKRFLAMLAVMTMIVSMFSGVAFAADQVDFDVELDNDMVTYVDGFYQAVLTGRLVDHTSGAVRGIDTTLDVYRDTNGNGTFDLGTDTELIDSGQNREIHGTDVTDGMFTLTFLTDLGLDTYFVVGQDASDSTTDYNATDYATFTIMYATELVQPTTLEWTWGDIPDTVIVQGMFPNEDNEALAEEIILAYTDGTEIAVADFANGSVFGFLFSSDDLVQTGELGLYINGTLAIEGEVFTNEMNVTVDPMEVMVGLDLDVEFTATFDFDDDYTNELDSNHLGNNLAPGYTLTLRITDADESEELPESPVNYEFGRVTANKLIEAINADRYAVGTYTFEFKLYYTDFVIEEATVDVEAVEADDFNLIGWDDSPLKVGDNEFLFCQDLDELDDGGRPILVTDERGGHQYIQAILNGAGLDDVVIDADSNNADPLMVSPTETGTVEVTINVYESQNDANDGYETLLHTFTRELEVEGWNVTVTPDTVDVDSEVDITITITDEDGNPVNNAIITSNQAIVQSLKVFDGTTTNVVGGVYVLTYDDDVLVFDTVGDIELSFWTETAFESNVTATHVAEVSFDDAIEVVGLEVYSVTSDTAVLLEGFTETVTVTPLDADGDVIYPTIDVTYYDADGDKIGSTVEGVSQTRVDTNDDGVKESVEIDLTPVAGAASALVNASTDSDKYFGKVELEVVKPQVVMTKAVNATAFVETDFEFTVLDPRDGSLIEDTVTVFEDNTNLTLATATVSEDDGVYTVTVFAQVVDYTQAEKDEEDVTFSFMMAANEQIELVAILVLEPTLTADPAEMIIGTASNIVLTYLDANGNPLEEYQVKLFGDDIAMTDENGQVAYASIATNTSGLEFTVATDNQETITCEVKSVVDFEAPMATLVEANGMATITITDNVRVQKAMVNGVLVDMFFAAPTVVHMTAQADQYHVQAIDQNFNYLMVTLEGASTNMLVVTVGEDTGFGPAELIEGTTMVPVRYAEELGAVVTWDDATESVTYTINGGEVVITVQIGNTTAMVNGVSMEMAVAPYINAQNRTMVPLRMIAQELGFTVNYVGGGVTQIQ